MQGEQGENHGGKGCRFLPYSFCSTSLPFLRQNVTNDVISSKTKRDLKRSQDSRTMLLLPQEVDEELSLPSPPCLI